MIRRNIRNTRAPIVRRGRFPIRRANRATTVNSTSHIRVNENQPKPVTTDLLITRRFEAIVTAAGTGAFTVSTKDLVDTIVGTSTIWDKVQFHRFDVYSYRSSGSTAAPYGRVAVTLTNPASGYFGDTPTGYADPPGQLLRAHVGIQPSSLFRNTWIDGADTSPLLTISSVIDTSSGAIVQFTAILRSTAGAPTAVRGIAEPVDVYPDADELQNPLDDEANIISNE